MATHVHRTHRSGWLRAAVLGANDGLLSIASLVVGVAAAHADEHAILISAVAGLVGGILAMGAGEYVSVSSQADTERADLEVERHALKHEYPQEKAELAGIYVRRGLDPELALRVADQLMAHDALGAHARDEIGISDALSARPFQAAFTSAASFAIGGIVPLAAAILASGGARIPVVGAVSLAFLGLLGAAAARMGGASVTVGAVRVFIWGVFTMGITSLVGSLFQVQMP